MSRWDALKPEHQTTSQERNQRRINTRDHSKSYTFDRSNETKRRDRRNHDTTSTKPSLRRHHVSQQKQHSTLRDNRRMHYNEILSLVRNETSASSQVRHKRIFEVAQCILTTPSCDLAECNVAKEVVDPIFLPFLEEFLFSLSLIPLESASLQQTYEIEATTTDTTTAGFAVNDTSVVVQQVLVALTHVVGDSYQTNRLLSPFVVEVSETGIEEQNPNPIRLRHLRVMQNLLRSTLLPPNTQRELSTQLQEPIAMCLLQTLKSTRMVEGTTKHALGSEADADLVLFKQLFVDANQRIANSRIAQLSLELLIAMVQRHPENSPQVISFLLMGQPVYTTKRGTALFCPHCVLNNSQGDAANLFFQVLHDRAGKTDDITRASEATRTSKLAADLAILALDNASPSLEQWLKPSPSSTPVQHSHHTFGGRIRSGFRVLLDICRCNLQCRGRSRNGDWLLVETDATLAGTLLRRVAFEDEILLGRGVALTTELMEQFLEFPLQRDRPGVGSSSSRKFEQQSLVADALIKAIGGFETPQGIFLEMSQPVKSFLDTRRGHTYLERLLRIAKSNESKEVQNVLRAILRTYPRPMLLCTSGGGNLWASLLELAFDNSSRTQHLQSHDDIQTLATLLHGRMHLASKDQVDDDMMLSSMQLVEDVLPQLKMRLESKTATNSKMAALTCYGSLLARDWDAFIRLEDLEAHSEVIFDICRDTRTNARVKKVAYKALGDVCTNYFSCTAANDSLNLNQNKIFCDSICKVVLLELEKEEESISTSMTLYALGNLARILKESNIIVVEVSTLERFGFLLIRICSCERREENSATDPKIQTNAVRALGHLICLLFSDKYVSNREKIDGSQALFTRSLDVLAFSVRQTLRLAQREIGGSWKERSAVKKIGWGACHTLGLILSVVMARKEGISKFFDENCRRSVQECLLTLMDCVSNLSSLNEKVGLAALSVLSSVDLASSRSRLCSTTSEQPIDAVVPPLGPVIVECIDCIFIHDDAMPNDGVKVLPQKTIFQVKVLLLHLLSCSSVSDAECVLEALSRLSDDGGRSRLRRLRDWLMQHNELDGKTENAVPLSSIPRAFDTFALAMHKRPDLVAAIDDVRLEQQFSNQSSRFIMALQPESLLYDSTLEAQADEEEEL